MPAEDPASLFPLFDEVSQASAHSDCWTGSICRSGDLFGTLIFRM